MIDLTVENSKKHKTRKNICFNQWEPPNLSYVSLRVLAPLPLDDGEGSHTQLVDTLSGIARKPNGEETSTVTENEDGDSFDLGSFCLEPCNVKRVVPERVLVVKFLPSDGVKLVAAGDNCRSCKGCVPAYFSPSGLSLATTRYLVLFLSSACITLLSMLHLWGFCFSLCSRDNYVGVLSGANFEDTSMIYHFSSTVCSISNFRYASLHLVVTDNKLLFFFFASLQHLV